jgi:DHA1 family tetracycline resistance protein-like MFS transporter
MGIIFPMLPELFISKNSVFPLVRNATDSMRHLFYGLSISLWSVGMFFGAPYLGELSDKFGRKKIFLTTLLMTASSYSLLAIAIYLKSIWVFLLSRMFSGFFAGNYEIAQASAADISTPENKARNMGWITFAFGMGFIIGPLITSVASSVRSFALTAPFWIASSLALINALLIWLTFDETFQSKKKSKIAFKKVFSSFLFAFLDSRLIFLSIIFFCIVSAWIIFFTGIPLYLVEIFDLNISHIALFYCLIGLSNIIAISIVQKYIIKKFTLKNIVIYTALITALVLLCLAFTRFLSIAAILIVIFSVVELLTYSSFLAFYSNAVSAEEQGKAMGGTAAISSIAFILVTPMMSMLANVTIKLPIILSGVLFCLSALLLSIKKE